MTHISSDQCTPIRAPTDDHRLEVHVVRPPAMTNTAHLSYREVRGVSHMSKV